MPEAERILNRYVRNYDALRSYRSAAFRCSRKACDNTLSIGLTPPLKAFLATRLFPSIVVGPVDFRHGSHVLISAACCALRSKVQPFAMRLLQ